MEKKDFRKLYEDLVKSDWFKKAYHDKSLGECPFEIPELRELEDEKIRKELLALVRMNVLPEATCLVRGGSVTRAQAEAYLEKQKYDRMQPVYDNLDSFESALAKAWKAYNDSGARTVDGCEDDYVECAHAKGFREGFLYGLEKQKEPHWCHHRVDLSNCSEEYMKAYYDGWNNCNQQHSQCEAEQKPAEWSEEDERILKGIIGKIDHDQTYGVSKVDMLSFLKSLRPQSHWKPSEEQPEVDLEKEIERVVEKYNSLANGSRVMKPSGIEKIARHFYELGLKARKEE